MQLYNLFSTVNKAYWVSLRKIAKFCRCLIFLKKLIYRVITIADWNPFLQKEWESISNWIFMNSHKIWSFISALTGGPTPLSASHSYDPVWCRFTSLIEKVVPPSEKKSHNQKRFSFSFVKGLWGYETDRLLWRQKKWLNLSNGKLQCL